jgi:hypothetical protein
MLFQINKSNLKLFRELFPDIDNFNYLYVLDETFILVTIKNDLTVEFKDITFEFKNYKIMKLLDDLNFKQSKDV